MSQKRKSLIVAQILFALVFAGVCLHFHAPWHEAFGDQGQHKIIAKYHRGEESMKKWLHDKDEVLVLIKAIPYLIGKIGWGIYILLLRGGLYVLYKFHSWYFLEITAAWFGAGIVTALPFLNPIPPAVATGEVVAAMSIAEWLRRGRHLRDLRFILIPAGSALLILAGVSGLIGNWMSAPSKSGRFYVHKTINDMYTNRQGDRNIMPVELNEVIIGPDTMTWSLTWHNKTGGYFFTEGRPLSSWYIYYPGASGGAFIEDDQGCVYRPIAVWLSGWDKCIGNISLGLGGPEPYGTQDWTLYFKSPQGGATKFHLYYPTRMDSSYMGYELNTQLTGWNLVRNRLRLK